MRDIIFKGKRIDNKKWIEGNLFFAKSIVNVGMTYICPELNKLDVAPDEKWDDGVLLGRFYEVDPKTVLQYTGIKDINGRMIFEGNIYLTNGIDGIQYWECKYKKDSFIWENLKNDYRHGDSLVWEHGIFIAEIKKEFINE